MNSFGTVFISMIVAFNIAATSPPAIATEKSDPWLDELPPLPSEAPDTDDPVVPDHFPIGAEDVVVTITTDLVCERRTEDSADEVNFEVDGKRLYGTALSFDHEKKGCIRHSGLELWQGIVVADTQHDPIVIRVIEEDPTFWIGGFEIDPDDLIGELSLTLVNHEGTVTPVLRARECAKSLKGSRFRLSGDGGSYRLDVRIKVVSVGRGDDDGHPSPK